MQFDIGKIGVNLVIKSPFLYTNMVRPTKVGDLSDSTPSFWIGEPNRGDEILQGIFNWGESKEVDLKSPWDNEFPTYSWLEHAHSFEWVYDVRKSIISNAQGKLNDWLKQWLNKYDKAEQPIWRSDIVARRLTSWLSNFDYLSVNMDKRTYNKFIDCISMHIGHLIFTNGYDCNNEQQKLTAKRGLIIGVLATNNKSIDIKSQLNDFCQILEDNLNSDGMNKMRNIPIQISFVKDAFMVRSMLNKALMDVPNILNNAIIKMLSALKIFIYPDGGLAHFASGGGNNHYLKQIFPSFEKNMEVPKVLEETGFYSVKAGDTQVLFDAGNRSDTSNDDAGILSFEMNYKKTRLFVNCGYYQSSDNPMYEACKNTAGHNSITVDNYNAMSLGNQSRVTNVTGSLIQEQDLSNDEYWSLLQGSHDGFKNVCGSVLKRAIAINEDGTQIRGEDRLEQINGVPEITSRFHLYPDAKVWVAPNKTEAMIQLGKTGWKFKVSNGELELDESFFIDKNGNYRKTNQIVFKTKAISQYITMRWYISLQPNKK